MSCTPHGNGADFFRGGITKVSYDRTGLRTTDHTRFYFFDFDTACYRLTGADHFEQVIRVRRRRIECGSIAHERIRTGPTGSKLRIFLGDAGVGPADFSGG